MLTTTNWEQSLKLILFKLQEKFPKNSMSTILQSFSIWSKLEWWKNFMSWLKKKKIIILKYCLLLFNAMTMNHFLIRLWYVTKKMDFIWQPAMTNWVVGLRRSSKALPKVKLAPKKKGHGHCLVVCCQSDPLQLSESQRNHYIWEVCSAYQQDASKAAMPAASIGQQKGSSSSPWRHLNTDCTTNISNIEWIRLWSFASPIIFTWSLANWLPLLPASWQLFAEKMLVQPVEWRKYFARVHRILKHRFLHYRNKNNLFLIGKKYVDCNGSYFD